MSIGRVFHVPLIFKVCNIIHWKICLKILDFSCSWHNFGKNVFFGRKWGFNVFYLILIFQLKLENKNPQNRTRTARACDVPRSFTSVWLNAAQIDTCRTPRKRTAQNTSARVVLFLFSFSEKAEFRKVIFESSFIENLTIKIKISSIFHLSGTYWTVLLHWWCWLCASQNGHGGP